MRYTYFRVQMWIAYNGIDGPDDIHPLRWRGILAYIKKEDECSAT